jgi:hypothetical protein
LPDVGTLVRAQENRRYRRMRESKLNRRGRKRNVMTVAYLFDPAHALYDLRGAIW